MMHRELAPRHLSLQQIKILPYFALWLSAKWYYKIKLYDPSIMGTNITASMSPQKTLGSRRTSWVLGKLQALRPRPPPVAPRNCPALAEYAHLLEGLWENCYLLFFKWYLWSTNRSTEAKCMHWLLFGVYEDRGHNAWSRAYTSFQHVADPSGPG